MNQISVSDIDIKARSYNVIWFLIAIWLASFTLRFGYGVYKLGEYRFQYYPAFVESELARNLVMYGELKAHTRYVFLEPKVMYSVRPPGFPFLLAVSYSIWGIENSVGVLFTLLILSSLTPIIIYKIGKTVFDKNVGLMSSCLFAVYPYSIAIESTLSSDTALFTETLGIHVLFLYKLLSSDLSSKNSDGMLIVGCGLSIAAAILFRSIALVLLPVPIILVLLFKKRVGAIFFLSFYLLSLSPLIFWGVRNYLLHDRIILGTTLDGYNFYKGNNPYTYDVYPFITLDSIDSKVNIAPSNIAEGDVNDFYFKKGIGFIRSIGGKNLWRCITKLGYFFSPIIIPLTNAYDGTSRSLIEHILYSIPYLAILMMAIVTIKQNLFCYFQRIFPMLLVISMSSIPYILTFSYSRYRYPIDVYLIILAAASLRHQIEKGVIVKEIDKGGRGFSL